MILIICILGVLLLGAAAIIYFLYSGIKNIVEENPDLFLEQYFDKYAADEFNCTLVISQQKGNFIGLIYDFSQYEEKNIVQLISYGVSNEDHFITILKNQKLYKLRDGSYQWDYRSML